MQQNTQGNIDYEITNYLGNINVVISDRKLWVPASSAFKAVVLSRTDYFPFGMEISSRTTNSDNYRFGYNGMESDNETKGSGNSYTTEFRQYDPRLGRWLSLDPLMAEYPMMSPYVAFNNNPIYFVDPLGLEGNPPGGKGKGQQNMNGSFDGYQDLPEVTVSVKKDPTFESKAEQISGDLIKQAGSAKAIQNNPGKFIGQYASQLFNYDPKSGTFDRSSLTHLGQLVEKNLQNQGYLESHAETLADVFIEASLSASTTTELELISQSRKKAVEKLQGQMIMGIFSPENVGTILFMSLPSGTTTQTRVFNIYRMYQLRNAYVSEVNALTRVVDAMRVEGKSNEQIARTVSSMRRSLGKKYKSLTPKNKRDFIYERNIRKYGDKWGPTIEYLRGKGQSWEKIIESSTTVGGKDMGL